MRNMNALSVEANLSNRFSHFLNQIYPISSNHAYEIIPSSLVENHAELTRIRDTSATTPILLDRIQHQLDLSLNRLLINRI